MVTQQELDEMQARCDAATPGKWEHRFGDFGNQHSVFFGEGVCQIIARGIGARGNGGREEEHATASFIAHSRIDMPRLIAEVKRLRAENEKLRRLARSAAVLVDSEGYGTEGNSDWDRLRENLENLK